LFRDNEFFNVLKEVIIYDTDLDQNRIDLTVFDNNNAEGFETPIKYDAGLYNQIFRGNNFIQDGITSFFPCSHGTDCANDEFCSSSGFCFAPIGSQISGSYPRGNIY